MKNATKIQIVKKLHSQALKIYKIYNDAIRTPANWQEERQRVLSNPDTRPQWKYEISPNMGAEKRKLQLLFDSFRKTREEKSQNIYLQLLSEVVEAAVNTALTKCDILLAIKDDKFQTSLNLRNRFYGLNYDYKNVQHLYNKLLKDANLKEVGKELGQQTTSAGDAALIVRKSIEQVKRKIQEVIPFPPQLKDKMLTAFSVKVEVVDDPSFSMRCTTDPLSLTTRVLLNKRRKYSPALLKIAYLHEFCGHALEMAVFDKTLVKDGFLPNVYSYAGVSSPNVFDVKAEVFADLIVAPFVEKNELKYVKYRRDVWLVCRAMADYLYNISGKTIKEVMKIYQAVGLDDFAFDEAVMASIFVDGYQGMYIFANQEIEAIQKKERLTDKELLTLLLYMGKIPIKNFSRFKQSFLLATMGGLLPS